MLGGIGDALSGVIKKKDGSTNWMGILLTAGLGIGGFMLFPDMGIVAGLIGAGLGVAVNHFVLTPKDEAPQPQAPGLPAASTGRAHDGQELAAKVVQDVGMPLVKQHVGHGLPAAAMAGGKAGGMMMPF